MKISLADYDVGNLHSVRKAFELNGASVEIVKDVSKLLDAKCVVFPGVGAFDMTMEKLLPFRDQIRDRLESGIPALGICIGAQITFGSSEEGRSPGLALFKGRVKKLKTEKIPHMGWNDVLTSDPLMDGIDDRKFYFAHSYYCSADDEECVIGNTQYENIEFPSFFRTKNVYGTQFHPEKSANSGLQVIRNFISFAEDVL